MSASMITNGKRDMDTGDLINTMKKKNKNGRERQTVGTVNRRA